MSTFTEFGQSGPEDNPSLEGWKGKPTIDPGGGNVWNPSSWTPPPVPKGGKRGSKKIQVHTPSMELFAKNIEELKVPVGKCYEALSVVDVAAGAFYDAYEIQDTTCGKGGLKGDYLKIIADLENGLISLCSSVREMIKEYSSTEEGNDMTTEELIKFMAATSSYFTTMNTNSQQLGD